MFTKPFFLLVCCLFFAKGVFGQELASNQIGLISAGNAYTCVINDSENLICWGSNDYQTDVPKGLGPVAHVGNGRFHSCVVKKDNTLACWGYVVNEDSIETYEPNISPPNDLGVVHQVASGSHNICTINNNQELSCFGWGANVQSEEPNQPEPPKVLMPRNLGKVKQVGVGDSTSGHFCAVKIDDTVSCWGSNYYGQAGVPRSLGKVRQVAVGSNYTCALKENGDVRCWGSNEDNRTVVPANLGHVKHLVAGFGRTCAIKIDNVVSCWGKPLLEYSEDHDQEMPISDFGKAIDGALGGKHICLIREDHSIECFGDNWHDQTSVPVNLKARKR